MFQLKGSILMLSILLSLKEMVRLKISKQTIKIKVMYFKWTILGFLRKKNKSNQSLNWRSSKVNSILQ
jgi:hypothetical protein